MGETMQAKTLKISSSFVLFAAAAAFAAETLGYDVLNHFATVSRYDAPAWALVLIGLAVVQLWLLRCSGCLKCRVWGDFVLQLSGLVLLMIGTAFVAAYPPFSLFMGVFPMLGLLFIFTGRICGNRTRSQLRGHNE